MGIKVQMTNTCYNFLLPKIDKKNGCTVFCAILWDALLKIVIVLKLGLDSKIPGSEDKFSINWNKIFYSIKCLVKSECFFFKHLISLNLFWFNIDRQKT